MNEVIYTFFYKNIVSAAKAEYSYFSVDFRLKYSYEYSKTIVVDIFFFRMYLHGVLMFILFKISASSLL